jgi:hypothetical protein
MLDRVAGAIRRERAFVVAASHDLRTPITALRTELELAARGNATRSELLAAIRDAHGDSVRLSELTADLLRLAEADANGRQLVRQPVAVRELLQGVLRRVDALAGERDVAVELQAPDVTVDVDRVRLEQAITNLLTNAIREAPEGSSVVVEAIVGSAGQAAGSSLSVRVLDRGPGVPHELREFLFVPFAAKASGRVHGNGLGLAVAAAAVRAHGGTIDYANRPGGGAVFSLTVPC